MVGCATYVSVPRHLNPNTPRFKNNYTSNGISSNQTGKSYYLKKVIVEYLKNQSSEDRSPFCYYTHAIGSNICGILLGFGDFFTYNILLLLIIAPLSSIPTKVLVTFGCMISIIIGLLATYWLGEWQKRTCLPGVPLPVILFSTYILLLDIFMTHPIECIEFSSMIDRIDIDTLSN